MQNNQEILDKINSNDENQIKEAFQEIQENGDLSMAGALLDLLGELPDSPLRHQTVGLLADIKDSHFRETLVSRLASASQPAYKSLLLRIAWESSLNYAPDLEVFLACLKDEDFSIALEASTAIENMLPHLTHEQFHRLEACCRDFPEEKRFLVENLLAEE